MSSPEAPTPVLARRPVQALLAVLVLVSLVAVLGRCLGGGAEAKRPGTLLGRAPITSGLPAWAKGWRITYTTEDGRGRRVTASAVVVTGQRGLAQQAPVLAVGHGTSGIVEACAPSAATGEFPIRPGAPVLPLLRQGWVVVQADYIGLGEEGPDGVHPYLDGRSEAHAILDATKAAHHLSGLDLSDRTVLYGTSQGGHAVLYAGALAPSYAPSLKLLGVAAAAPATDLAGLVRALGSSVIGMIIDSYLAVSWEAVHPEAHVRDDVTDWSLARAIAAGCDSDAGAVAQEHRAEAPVLRPSVLTGEVGRLLRENTPTLPIDVPLLVGQGLADPVVRPQVQQRWVAGRCAAGQHLDYRTYPGLTHDTLVAPGSPFIADVGRWIDDRFRGRPATPTC